MFLFKGSVVRKTGYHAWKQTFTRGKQLDCWRRSWRRRRHGNQNAYRRPLVSQPPTASWIIHPRARHFRADSSNYAANECSLRAVAAANYRIHLHNRCVDQRSARHFKDAAQSRGLRRQISARRSCYSTHFLAVIELELLSHAVPAGPRVTSRLLHNNRCVNYCVNALSRLGDSSTRRLCQACLNL